MVSKVFEKLESKRIVDHLEKYGLFLIFNMVFSINGYIDVKMVGSVLEEKSLLRCWGWPSLLNWIRVAALSLLLKLPPRRLEL